jgi:uncharacterized membrane protein YqjE
MSHVGSPTDSSATDYAETASPPADGIFSGIANAFSLVRRVCSDLLRLFALEVRRAGLTLMWMVALGAIAAMLVVAAWLGLMGVLALWAVSLGATWIGAIVAISLANLLAAATSLFLCVAMSRDLLFPATQRQLAMSSTESDTT